MCLDVSCTFIFWPDRAYKMRMLTFTTKDESSEIHIEGVFSLEQLPILWDKRSSIDHDRTSRVRVNKASNELVGIIQTTCGYKFHLRRTKNNYNFQYFCSQDSERQRTRRGHGHRDRREKQMYQCSSGLRLKFDLPALTLSIEYQHRYHSQAEDITIPLEALRYIEERLASATPAEIFRDLVVSAVDGSNVVTRHQVAYRWQIANARLWKREVDPLRSAQVLLEEMSAEYDFQSLQERNLKGLAFFSRKIIDLTTSSTIELSMDASFGTNSAGMQLFAVLGELDGAGVPIGYCFLGVDANETGQKQSAPGAMTLILVQFLKCKLYDFGMMR